MPDVKGVDDRDIRWEENSPRFRVMFYDSVEAGESAGLDSYELSDVDVLQAITWAFDRAEGREVAVSVLTGTGQSEGSGAGQIWLLGGDPNSVVVAEDAPEWKSRMQWRVTNPPVMAAFDSHPSLHSPDQ